MSPIPVIRKDKNEPLNTAAPSSDSAPILRHIGGIVNRIAAITGLADWKTDPPITLQGARNHVDRVDNPHGTTAAQVGAITEALLPIKIVRFAAGSNINIAGNGLAQIDGVTTPVAGDRVLLMTQTDPVQNGIYVASTGAWARATDADTGTEIKSGTIISIKEGIYGSRLYQLGFPETDPVIGTDGLFFDRLSRRNASESLSGETRFATSAETTAGTASDIAVHPAGLDVELDKKFDKAGGTITGDVTFGDDVILARDPAADLQAATKRYVDASRAGFYTKPAVRAASIGNIDLSTGGLTPGGLDAGAGLTAGDRVLVKNQTTASQNGIYTAAAGAWTRATDSDTSAEMLNGLYVFVDMGEKHGGEGWILNTSGTITLGTTALNFEKFIDGYAGSSPNVAWDPVRVATTADTTLSGLQTVDSVNLAALDRVLVMAQADQTQNGIYNASSGAWTRALDANESRVFTPGKVVSISEGATHRDKLFALDNTVRPTIGSSAITFVVLAGTGGGGGGGGGGGSVYWKDAVRVATVGNISLSGAQTIDGVAVVAGDRVGVIAQNDPAQNGIYVVAGGAWSRAIDADSAPELDAGFQFTVRAGRYKNVTLANTSVSPVNVGVTPLIFKPLSGPGSAAGKVCNLRRSSATSMVYNAWGLVPWNVEESDPLNMFNPAANTQIVIQEDGDYLINSSLIWTASTTATAGGRWHAITKNSTNPDTPGTTLLYDYANAADDSSGRTSISGIASLVQGDILRVYTWQNTGAALNLGLSSMEQAVRFSVCKIESSNGAAIGVESPQVGAFVARKTVNQTIPQWEMPKLVFNTKDYDVSGWFTTGTSSTDSGSRFQPKKEGLYQINITAYVPASQTNNSYLSFRKNGASGSGGLVANARGEGTMAASGLVYFNGTTDYGEVFYYADPGVTLNANSTTADFKLSGFYAGAIGSGSNVDPHAFRTWDLFHDQIFNGLNPSIPASGLNLSVPSGVAQVLGRRIAVPGFTVPVPANSTGLHVDLLETGTHVTTTSSSVTTSAVRLFTITSSGTAITAITPVLRRRDPNESWINMTSFQQGWQLGTGQHVPAYKKLANGIVVFKGMINGGTIGWNVAYTLPVGYRPIQNATIPVSGNGVTAAMRVTWDGGMYFFQGSSGAVDLDGIWFPAGPYIPAGAFT